MAQSGHHSRVPQLLSEERDITHDGSADKKWSLYPHCAQQNALMLKGAMPHVGLVVTDSANLMLAGRRLRLGRTRT
jgi:hypothetical protein